MPWGAMRSFSEADGAEVQGAKNTPIPTVGAFLREGKKIIRSWDIQLVQNAVLVAFTSVGVDK